MRQGVFGRGVGRAKHGAGREKCVLSTPVTSPLKPPLLWGRLRPRERRFDRPYVFHMLLCDYVFGAFLPSLLGWCRNADPVINIGPGSILGPGLSPMIENQSNRMLYAVSTHPDVELGGKQGELRGGCLIGLLHLS